MFRSIILAFAALTLIGGPGRAQSVDTEVQAPAPPSPEQVAQARLAYIAGDYATALTVLRPAAEAGNPVAQNILGVAYELGNGIEVDFEQAQHWWKLAAEQDFDRALFNLGRFYAKDAPEYPTDPALAAAFFDRASSLDYSEAMVGRAQLHELGLAGPVDNKAAATLYRRAVGLGNTQAMNGLGNMHIEARGIEEDLPGALALFRQAAQAGDAVGLSNLGVMYEHGYGVGRDLMVAMALYEKAARLGQPRAAVNLAYLLAEGESGWSNPVRGLSWCLAGLERSDPVDRREFEADCEHLGEGLDEAARISAAERSVALMNR